MLVSGSLIEDSGILNIIESAGGRIVADDLCNGYRQLVPPDGQGETSMDRVIDRYLNRFPCPARSRAVHLSAAEMGIMFVMVTLQGSRIAVDYLTRVRDEIKQKADTGGGVICKESIERDA